MKGEKRAIICPLTKRHKFAFHWRANDGPRLNADLVALIFIGCGPVLLRIPIYFSLLRVGGSDPLSLWMQA